MFVQEDHDVQSLSDGQAGDPVVRVDQASHVLDPVHFEPVVCYEELVVRAEANDPDGATIYDRAVIKKA